MFEIVLYYNTWSFVLIVMPSYTRFDNLLLLVERIGILGIVSAHFFSDGFKTIVKMFKMIIPN